MRELFASLSEYIVEKTVAEPVFSEFDDASFWENFFEGSFADSTSMNFASSKKNCTPGKSYSCKSTCIAVNRNCLNPIEGQAKNYAAWLQTQNKKEQTSTPSPGAKNKPKPPKPPKSPEGKKVTTPAKTPTTQEERDAYFSLYAKKDLQIKHFLMMPRTLLIGWVMLHHPTRKKCWVWWRILQKPIRMSMPI